MSNTSVQRAFIRGYFSADGSCKGNNIRVVSNARPLLYQMQTMLTYMGIYCSVGPNGKPSSKDGYKRQNSWQMMVRGISSDKFMREIGFEGLKSTQYGYKEPVKRGDRLKDSGIEEIVEITNLPEDKVYGALVDGSVYNANGLITHNSHAIGMNMIGSILDEANFFQNGAQNPNKSAIEYSKIAEMYSSIVNRSKSRFKSHKRDDSLSVLISSNTTSSSFTEKRIKEVEGEENALVINARVWDVKPKGTYSDEMFWVFTGSDLLDPYIVKGVEDVYQYTDSMEIPRKEGTVDEIINALLIGREKFVQVPMDFYKQYEDNLIMSLQDISGLSVAPSGRLFSSKPLYRDVCNTTLEHPFYKSEIMISTHDEIAIKDYLRKDYRPPRRNKKRFIHVDQSTTNDSTGFASSYIDRYEKDKVSGLWMPIVATDILLRINPPKAPRKISISKVRDFIFYMRDVWDLEIGYVTYDSFASEESLQVLSENGIPCGLLSVDRTDAQYLNLINLIYEHRLETYRYVPAEEELFELIHFRGAHRVDHPQDGSKDVCDGWAGSVWNAITQTKDETPKAEGNSMGHIIAMGRDESPYSLEELLGGIIL